MSQWVEGRGGRREGGREGASYVSNKSPLFFQITKHYSKPGVVAEEVLPVFPDFEVCNLTECCEGVVALNLYCGPVAFSASHRMCLAQCPDSCVGHYYTRLSQG